MTMKSCPGSLYYYCSMDTFKSILENMSFWLNDVKMSNDTSEIDWGFTGISTPATITLFHAEALDEGYALTHTHKSQADSEGRYVTWDGSEVSSHYCFACFAEDPDLLDEARIYKTAESAFGGPILDRFPNTYSEERRSVCNRFYTFCVSECCDLLSQWRGYADNGRGVCLELDSSYFRSLVEECGLPIFSFDYVRYGHPRFDDFIRSGRKYFPHLDSNERLIRMAPFYKHESFEEEREWRLVLRLEDHTYREDISKIMSAGERRIDSLSLEARVAGSRIVPHVELKPKDFGDVLRGVIVGPSTKAHREDVELLLSLYGMDAVCVRKSKSSYTSAR